MALGKNPLNLEARRNYGLNLLKNSGESAEMKRHAYDELLMADVLDSQEKRK